MVFTVCLHPIGMVFGLSAEKGIMAVNTRLTAPTQVHDSAIAISQRSNIDFVSEAVQLAIVVSVSIFLESSISSQIECTC